MKILSDFERPHSLLYPLTDNLVQENNYNKQTWSRDHFLLSITQSHKLLGREPAKEALTMRLLRELGPHAMSLDT